MAAAASLIATSPVWARAADARILGRHQISPTGRRRISAWSFGMIIGEQVRPTAGVNATTRVVVIPELKEVRSFRRHDHHSPQGRAAVGSNEQANARRPRIRSNPAFRFVHAEISNSLPASERSSPTVGRLGLIGVLPANDPRA